MEWFEILHAYFDCINMYIKLDALFAYDAKKNSNDFQGNGH